MGEFANSVRDSERVILWISVTNERFPRIASEVNDVHSRISSKMTAGQ